MKTKYIALLPVRDESDIITECLLHALTWADRVYVYDTGSVDDTYDKVLDLSRSDKRIYPLGSDPVYYNENRVRGYLFHAARRELTTGDWFLRIDADEFHHIRPPDFAATYLKSNEGVVYHQYYDFHLTTEEASALSTSSAIVHERSHPITQRRRHYTVSLYSEPRMCRYRQSMRWPGSVSFPYNAGLVSAERIPIRHYPHRDPEQLRRRCRLRAIMMSDSTNRSHWTRPDRHHWSVDDWSQFVLPSTTTNLMIWQQDRELPRYRQTNHIARGPKRIAQQLLYLSHSPTLLDLFRSQWSSADYPLAITPAVQYRLTTELCR
jgi:hypothetical protein